MSMHRREFLQLLALAAASGMALNARSLLAGGKGASFYDVPAYGNVHFLHFTDCHAQLLPVYYREPDTNIGVGDAAGKPPHLVGEALLRHFGVAPGTPEAYAFTALDFAEAARTYGRVGGFAHLATLAQQLRASRPHAVLLDGGDTWQGSATALWSKGQDMVEACKQLGVDMMCPHWEFTLGAERVKELIEKDLKGRIEFLAHNVKTDDFGDPVFKSTAFREMNGVRVAVIGQAFPYTPIAHPRHLVTGWTFGIQEEELQKAVDAARAAGAKVVVVLSHNGMDVDVKLAGRITGVDAILGGHTHDAVPVPIQVSNAGGTTLVINSGSNGKFLSVLDFAVKNGKVSGFRYKLLPVFSNLLPADPAMSALIDRVRKPWQDKLSEPLAVSEGLLFRRGNFNGSWDQLILDAMLEVKDAEIAFSPGFRWGTALLPGQTITRSDLMDQTAITYPHATLTEMTGSTIKAVLEDVCDNLFNPDPYLQQGGDMVRVGGLTYSCAPRAAMGNRIRDLRLAGEPLDAARKYRVAGWAPVAEGATGEPIWDVVATWLKHHKTVSSRTLNQPMLL